MDGLGEGSAAGVGPLLGSARKTSRPGVRVKITRTVFAAGEAWVRIHAFFYRAVHELSKRVRPMLRGTRSSRTRLTRLQWRQTDGGFETPPVRSKFRLFL